MRKSRAVEIVQNAGGVFNLERQENEGEYGKKRDWSCRRQEGIYIRQCLRFDSYPAFCWSMNTKRSSLHLAQQPSTP